MAEFTSVTVTAWCERRGGKTTIKVDARGDTGHGGIVLVEVPPVNGCYRDGAVLCVEVKFDPKSGNHLRWPAEDTFDRSADYVVLLYNGHVLTAKPVDKV